jgi:phosphate transport system protein
VRDIFHDQLDELNVLLGQMAGAAQLAMRHASAALLDLDSAAAAQAHDATAGIGKLFYRAEELACLILARQQPVALDLRLIIASLHASTDLDRMGQLADHVARIAMRHHPEQAIRIEACPGIRQMATVADEMAGKAAKAIRDRDAALAEELPHDDDRMDALHRQLWATLLGDWEDGVQPAIDAAMLGRFYERYADHAVSAARQVVYVVTGKI